MSFRIGQRNPLGSDKGFTLVELLISLVIGSVVLTGVVLIYSSLSKSYTTETARAGAQEDIRSGLAVMVEDIRMAGLDPLGTAGGGFTISDPTDIEFITDLDFDGSLDAGEQIRYFLNGTQLIQRMDDDATTDEVLLENVSSLNFSYEDGGREVVVDMTVEKPAGKRGTVSRSLTERIRIRNL